MPAINGESSTKEEAAVKGINTGEGGFAIWGICATGHAVHGESTSSKGVVGVSDSFQGVCGQSRGNAGVYGESHELHGVYGDCHNPNGAGVFGTNDKGGMGVEGSSPAGRGVSGHSDTGDGVVGLGRRGVVGESETFQGVYGKSRDNAGVVGESDKLHAVYGICHNPNGGGIYGVNDAGGPAAVFAGHVTVDGDLNLKGRLITDNEISCRDIHLTNADCAEEFDVNSVGVEPGSVLVIGGGGTLKVSATAYDTTVAGVVSGAGQYRPALVLDAKPNDARRQPVALIGKVSCLVDADAEPIAAGDLLTSSSTPGHAMKASDTTRALGAVIGKALDSLEHGKGLIPVLIALQ